MRLSIKRAGNNAAATTDTIGTSSTGTGPAVADAGKIPHLDATGKLSGVFTLLFSGNGVPVDGTTGDNIAPKGSLYVDLTNANLYVQTGLITNPVYKLVTRAA